MAAFEKTDELNEVVDQVIRDFYPATLQAVNLTVDVLWHESEDGLQFHGRPAYAYVKIQGAREKANGASDVLMVVDKRAWKEMTPEQQLALVDHELHHVVPKKAKDGSWKFDDHGRPRLTSKQHDIEVGWFLDVAKRHGQNAIEVRQAQDLLTSHKKVLFQLELPLGDRTAGVATNVVNFAQTSSEDTVVDKAMEEAGKFSRDEVPAPQTAEGPKPKPAGSRNRKAAAKA